MKEATYDDAVLLAKVLDLHQEKVWTIIRGMKYSTLLELGRAVQQALTGIMDGSRTKERST